MQSKDDVESADLVRLLRGLSSDTPAPPAAMDRVSDRLAASIALGAASVGAAAVATKVASPLGSAWASRWLYGSFARAAVLHGAGLVAGGVAGAAIHASWQRPEVRVVYVDRVVTAPPMSESRGEAVAPAEENSAPSTAEGAQPKATSSDGETRTDSSRMGTSARRVERRDIAAEERKALDAARRSLLEGKPEACLQKLQEHLRAFPSGQLVEEREAMMVNALVGTGAYDAARKKGESFRRTYPRSLLAPSVDAALQAIP